MKLDTIGKNIRKFREIKKMILEINEFKIIPKITVIIKNTIFEYNTKKPYWYIFSSSYCAFELFTKIFAVFKANLLIIIRMILSNII